MLGAACALALAQKFAAAKAAARSAGLGLAGARLGPRPHCQCQARYAKMAIPPVGIGEAGLCRRPGWVGGHTSLGGAKA